MKKIGFVVTAHWSSNIRPNGNDLLYKFYTTLKENVVTDISIYIVDNQSEFKLDIPKDAKYIRIDNQYETGLTGAWNTGILAAYNDGCDIIINCNDDLWFNDTINKFINYICNDYNKNIIYTALTNGVLGGPQLANGPSIGIKQISCSRDNDVVNGFFFAFTKEHYEMYRYTNLQYFPLKHEYDGGDGKWGGQEGYWLILNKLGVSGVVVLETFIPHTKYRSWLIGRSIDNNLNKI